MTKLYRALLPAVFAVFVGAFGGASVQAASMPVGIGSAIDDASKVTTEEVQARRGGGRRVGGGRVGGGRYVGGGRRFVGGPRYGYRRYGYRRPGVYFGAPIIVGAPRCVWRARTVWSNAYGGYVVRRVRVCRY